MGGFNFPAFLLEALHQLSPPLTLQFGLHLGETFLDCLCLEVLACLFACLLMSEEDLPEWGYAYIAYSMFLSSMAGREMALLRLFYLPCIILINDYTIV